MHTCGVMAHPYSAGAVANNRPIKEAPSHVRSWIVKYTPESLFVIHNERWNAVTSMARQCELHGDYGLAEAILLKGLQEVSEFSVRDPRVLQTVTQIADLYFHWGNLTEAKKYFQLEARLIHVIFGKYHVNAASTLSRLGTVYFVDESFPAAELCFRQALQIHVRLSGMDSSEARIVAQNLALVIDSYQTTAEAELNCEPLPRCDFSPTPPEESEAENIVSQFVTLLAKNKKVISVPR
jgi:tetratricopeptide (TPR) repeat protein